MVYERLHAVFDASSLAPFLVSLYLHARGVQKSALAKLVWDEKKLEVLLTSPMFREAAERAFPRALLHILEKRGLTDTLAARIPLLAPLQHPQNNADKRHRVLLDARRFLDEARRRQILRIVNEDREFKRQLVRVAKDPRRRVLVNLAPDLVRCVARKARREQTRKRDLHVVSSILLIYDVAVALPLQSQPGITPGILLAVIDDYDLRQALTTCLQEYDINIYVKITDYKTFRATLLATRNTTKP